MLKALEDRRATARQREGGELYRASDNYCGVLDMAPQKTTCYTKRGQLRPWNPI